MITRRQFVQLGFAAAAITPATVMSAPLLTPAFHSLGAILSESRLNPLFSAQVLSGLMSSGVALQTEWTTTTLDAMHASEQLLAKGVRVVVALIGAPIVPDLVPIYAKHNALLVVVNAGENFPIIESPHVVYSTLNYLETAFLAGRYGAETFGPRALRVNSWYEAGFDTLYAFEQGLTQAGGALVDTVTTHTPNGENLGVAIDAIRTLRPDFVYASYYGDTARQFMQAYRGAGLLEDIPLLGSAFMSDDSPIFAGMQTIQVDHISNAFTLLGQRTIEQVRAGQFKPHTHFTLRAVGATAHHTLSMPNQGIRTPELKTGWLRPYLSL